MADNTAIEWTDATWNPTVGCSIMSKGCTNCYAMKLAARLEAMRSPIYRGLTKRSNGGPVWTGSILINKGALLKPLSWRKPRRIFVNSMSDLFHEALPDAAIDQVFAVMALCPQHTFQVLTKRPQRMRNYMRMVTDEPHHVTVKRFAHLMPMPLPKGCGGFFNWPLPNVWLGVSVEDQATADARIPVLLDTPAALRFISAEPLLGVVDLTKVREQLAAESVMIFDALAHPDTINRGRCRQGLDWVIAGGESGPGARPAHPDWFRALRDQCAAAGVPFHFKQWGSWFPMIDRDVDDPDGRRDYTVVDRAPKRYRILNLAGGCGFHGARVHLMQRYAKRAAGALLDGREHREFPR